MLTLTSKVAQAVDDNLPLTWIVKITLDGGALYFASMPCTISGVSYVGGYILKGGFGDIEEGIDILEGGGSGYIGAMSITLNEIVIAGGLHSLFSPHDSDIWINRKIEFGLIYNDGGSLSTSDITWLYTGRVDDAAFSQPSVDLKILDWNEFENMTIPKKIINADDYPNAPKESLGLPLPILYGDFYSVNDVLDSDHFGEFMVCPTVCIDKTINKFAIAGHTTHTALRGYYHDGSIKSFAQLAVYDTSSTVVPTVEDTDDNGISTIYCPSGSIIGFYKSSFSNVSEDNNVANAVNAIDENRNTYVTLTNENDEISFYPAGLPSGAQPDGLNIGLSSYYARFFFSLYETVSSDAAHFEPRVKAEDGTESYTGVPIVIADGVTFEKAALITKLGNVQDYSKWKFLIRKTNATAGTLKVKSFGFMFYFFIKEQITKPVQPKSRKTRPGGPRHGSGGDSTRD